MYHLLVLLLVLAGSVMRHFDSLIQNKIEYMKIEVVFAWTGESINFRTHLSKSNVYNGLKKKKKKKITDFAKISFYLQDADRIF